VKNARSTPWPARPDDELLTLNNVALSRHSPHWTHSFNRAVAPSTAASIVAVGARERTAGANAVPS